MSSPGIPVAREIDLDTFAPGLLSSPHDSSSSSSPPTSDSDSDTDSDTSDTAAPNQDGASRLYHVYEALMASLLPPITTTTTLHHPDEQPTTTDDKDAAARETFSALESEQRQQDDAAADAGEGGSANAAPGIKNAKRRKMDKKKAKREEQKLHAAEEEAVEVVDFKLFSRQRVKPISLLPAEEPTWHVPNPRHVPLTEQQSRALRDRIGSVAVDGNGVHAGARTGEPRKVHRVYVVEGKENDHEKGPNIVHLSAPRDHVPPFSAAYFARHPSYRPPPLSTFSKPLPAKHPQNSKKKNSNPSTNAPTGRGATPGTHTIQDALKRSTMQKKQRAAAHIVFTAHTKPLPFHTPAAAQALAALAIGTHTTDPAAHPSGKVPGLDVLSPAAAGKVNKERKAHLRRIARRTARINVTSAANSPTAGVGAAAAAGTKPMQRPWTLPSASASASNVSFYAPPEDLGGKSAGYGWGFAASRPGVREWEAARRKGGLYVRDRMR